MAETKKITSLYVVTDSETSYDNIGDIDGGLFPDNVMIHPAHKNNIYDEVESTTGYTMDRDRMTHCFGMKVIWTDDIGEDEVICTYNGR